MFDSGEFVSDCYILGVYFAVKIQSHISDLVLNLSSSNLDNFNAPLFRVRTGLKIT